jgi:virginiamycin A acetyltransferase
MGSILDKFFILILKFFRRDISVDFFSDIRHSNINKILGLKDYKVSINKSTLVGDISIGYGCKIDRTICSGNIKIGRFSSLNGPGTRISSNMYGVEIRSFSSIAPNVIIQEDNHRMDKVSTYYMNNNVFMNGIEKDISSKGKIIIEEDVWIGSNSVVLSGVKIGRGSIIGAGSVVTKDIPRYSIAVGNPARVIKLRFPKKIVERLENSKWWEWDIDKINQHKEDFNKDLYTIGQRDEIFHQG